MDIEQLPDFPAIRQIAEALWRFRASVFVGAGFSRNADLVSADTPLPPLWDSLAQEMSRQLYAADLTRAPKDALRLAEEYRRFFGQAALNDFVRIQIRDAAWSPGIAHKLLLELPWSDVLTTNYDTLLERAALEINRRSYEIVRIESDFTHARAPRIVKLHGSIGTSEHFTIAEDDYRTYPASHAAFVNFARQSFLENELCLLGFSGDDANFLQWSGWVRDHLGSSSRRIYLVGLLNLSAANRKYLEAKNIAPIDLGGMVSDFDDAEKHGAAATRFLQYLHDAQPQPKHNWRPAQKNLSGLTQDDLTKGQQDSVYAAQLYREAVEVWRRDRESYPGWLICPRSARVGLVFQMHETPWPTTQTLQGLDEIERARVLYEMLWRMQTGLMPLDPSFIELITPYADPAISCGLSKAEQLQVASALASDARQQANEPAFARWTGVIAQHTASGTDNSADALYQKALWARDCRDLGTVEETIPKIVGSDPIWGLRRAALLCSLGEIELAEGIVTETLADLRKRQRQDRTSLSVASRRAWAEWFARALRRNRFMPSDPWDEEFREPKCDPWQLIEEVEETLGEAAKKQRANAVPITPQFEAGHYKDSANTVHFGGSGTSPEEEFRRLAEDAGIPLRLEHVNLLGDCVQELIEMTSRNDAAGWLRLIGFIGDHNDPILDRYFGRASIAAISVDERAVVVGTLKKEIGFWRPRLWRSDKWNLFAVEKVRTLVEVLARFSACEPSEQALDTHEFALDIGRNTNPLHFWIFEPLGRLLEFSSSAVAPNERHRLVLADLEFPTAGEKALGNLPNWPTPSSWLDFMRPIRPKDDPRWALRVAKLIELAGSSSPDRPEATFRLAYLTQSGVLTGPEAILFAKALWSNMDDGDPSLPAVKYLLNSALLWLPTPPDIEIEPRLRKRIYSAAPEAIDVPLVEALVALGEPNQTGQVMLPNAVEAVRLFDTLVTWRKKIFDHPLSEAFGRSEQTRKATAIGRALGETLSPALARDERTEGRLSALLRFIDELDEPTALTGLPRFVGSVPSYKDRIVERIERAILATSFREVNAGVVAIRAWIKEPEAPVPDVLVERLVSAFEVRRWPGLAGLVGCLNRMVAAKLLSGQQLQRLDIPLGDLIEETAYERIDPSSAQAVSFSLVRQECVRLAKSLVTEGSAGPNATKWLELAPTDPLPEVRYANG